MIPVSTHVSYSPRWHYPIVPEQLSIVPPDTTRKQLFSSISDSPISQQNVLRSGTHGLSVASPVPQLSFSMHSPVFNLSNTSSTHREHTIARGISPAPMHHKQDRTVAPRQAYTRINESVPTHHDNYSNHDSHKAQHDRCEACMEIHKKLQQLQNPPLPKTVTRSSQNRPPHFEEKPNRADLSVSQASTGIVGKSQLQQKQQLSGHDQIELVIPPLVPVLDRYHLN
jgi:hypothetical protein